MKEKKKNKNLFLWIILIVLVLLVSAVAYKAKQKPKGEEVKIEEVKKRTIHETVSASGKVFPETEIKISSDVSGEVVKLMVEEGDSVLVGQILAKIDPDNYLSAVERGKAGLNSAKSQIAMSEAQIKNNMAQKEQIAAQAENARLIHGRNEKLLKEGVISQADFDQSLATIKGLDANLRAAEAMIESSKKTVEGARYAAKSSEAQLKEFQTSLNRTTIKAPANGIVSSLSIEQGERVVGTIQMTGTEMMRIANLNSMEVLVDVSENDILRVSNGDKVDIEVDAYLGKKFKGVVTQIANSASNITGSALSLNTDQVTNFVVRVRIDQNSYQDLAQKYPFRPGMSASVDIFTNSLEDQISIPIQAVTTRENEDEDEDEEGSTDVKSSDEDYDEVVFVFDADTISMVKVKTDIQDDEYIVVLEGLKEGQEIVTGPYSAISKKLESGDTVRKEDKDKKKDKKKKK